MVGVYFSYNKKHIVKIENKIMEHEAVNFRRKSYGFQLFPKLCIFY